MNDDNFSPPEFQPADALLQLKRSLRNLRPLSERGDTFDLKGVAVLDLSNDATAINVRLAKRPARSPDWDRFTLKSNPDLRRLVDEVRKRLARWTDEQA